jgi:selenide,water dikinase
VTLLVDRPLALYSGMVPGFIAGQYGREDLAFDLERWAARTGAELVQDRATGFDPTLKLIHLANGDSLPYDVCSWNIGSAVHGLELPGVRQYALRTRPIGAFVEQVLAKLEAAAVTRGQADLRLVLVGGGAAGVELALCMQSRARVFGASAIRVHVLCASSELLPGSPASLRRRIEGEFRRRGVEHSCSTRVVELRDGAVELHSGDVLPADLVVWVTGAASHLPTTDDAPSLTPHGWIPVRNTLQHVDHPELFAAGDCAELVDHPTTPKAGVFSVRQGPVLAHNLRAVLAGTSLRSYEPQPDFLVLLNLGDGRAAGAKWGCSFSGRWVMRWKNRIDRAFMKRFS